MDAALARGFRLRGELAAIAEGRDIGIGISHLPNFLIAALVFSFGLIALLYLVTRKVLVEHISTARKAMGLLPLFG